MKKLAVLTGAGISAESGLKTFRGENGLWNNHRIEEVASPEAWQRDPLLVLEFYNQRRKQLYEAAPNAAHFALVRLEAKYTTTIITQNVDDMHERAGSKNILHLHGELKKARSTAKPDKTYDIDGWELKWGDLDEDGHQLRPHIVWFGEPVPMMQKAIEITEEADIFIVIGTSLVVYPAASLLDFLPHDSEKYYVDPGARDMKWIANLTIIREKATLSVPPLVDRLLKQA
jgi:NAD-dependent deacetylase